MVLCAAPIATASPLITLTGRGWGHGVGMSQDGAEGMARKGATSSEILAHFYRGTKIDERTGQRIRVLLREASAVTHPGRGGREAVGRHGRSGGGRRFARRRGRWPAGALLLVDGAGKEVARGTVLRVAGGGPIKVSTRRYRGTIELRRFKGAVRAIDDIALEDYVRGVIAWEMPSSWHAAALGAQAVAARSYALAESASGGQFDVFRHAQPDVRGRRGRDAEHRRGGGRRRRTRC